MTPLSALVPEASSAHKLIAHVTTDSRDATKGSLFFDVFGSQQFVQKALANGAVVVTEDANLEAINDQVVTVASCKHAAGFAADQFYNQPSQKLRIVGVTGTNGKTSTTHYIAHCLSWLHEKVGLIGTLGAGLWGEDIKYTGYTTPDVVSTHSHLAQFISHQASYAAMEVSSHGLDQGRVAGVRFDFAVFLNLSHDHLDYHGDMEQYADAKAELFGCEDLEFLIVNDDDLYANRMLNAGTEDAKVFRFGEQDHVELQLLDVSYRPNGTEFTLKYRTERQNFKLNLVGDFNVQNVMAAISVCLCAGYELRTISEALESAESVPGRMQLIQRSDGAGVVIDYAHTPDALEKACEAARMGQPKRLIVVFGCGGDRDQAKRPEMARVSERLADQVIVTSDNPRFESEAQILDQICDGFDDPQPVLRIADRAMAIEHAIGMAESNDIVLIAGKGHEEYQDIRGKRLPFSDIATAQSALLQYERGLVR